MKETFYRYNAFGLRISSSIPIPEFLEAGLSESQPDLIIRTGKVPSSLDNPSFTGVTFSCSPGKFLLHMNDIADYLAENGTSIIVSPAADATPEDIRLFLLGSVFGAILHQRGFLTIHGSAITKEQNAFIISGNSGAGKSTLAAAFVDRGWQLLSDDLSAITLDENQTPWIHPAYPQLKLWEDALKKLGKQKDTLKPVRKQLLKFGLPKNEDFSSQSVPIRAIFFLQTKNSGGSTLEEIKGVEKFTIIRNNTYRYQFIDGLGMTQKHFELSGKLASHALIYKIIRTNQYFSIPEILDLLEPVMEKLIKDGKN